MQDRPVGDIGVFRMDFSVDRPDVAQMIDRLPGLPDQRFRLRRAGGDRGQPAQGRL
jgi:hypothetical protein